MMINASFWTIPLALLLGIASLNAMADNKGTVSDKLVFSGTIIPRTCTISVNTSPTPKDDFYDAGSVPTSAPKGAYYENSALPFYIVLSQCRVDPNTIKGISINPPGKDLDSGCFIIKTAQSDDSGLRLCVMDAKGSPLGLPANAGVIRKDASTAYLQLGLRHFVTAQGIDPNATGKLTTNVPVDVTYP